MGGGRWGHSGEPTQLQVQISGDNQTDRRRSQKPLCSAKFQTQEGSVGSFTRTTELKETRKRKAGGGATLSWLPGTTFV